MKSARNLLSSKGINPTKTIPKHSSSVPVRAAVIKKLLMSKGVKPTGSAPR